MNHDQDILDYLQDRLSSADRGAFENRMAQDASLAAEVDVMRSVRAELASGPKHENAEVVWEKISKDISSQPAAANDNRHPWTQALKYAAVALLAIGAWHFTIVPRITDSATGFRTASETLNEFSFQVKFEDSATLGDIAGLISPLGGRISDGPSALGLLRLSFPDESSSQDAMQRLEENEALVEFVAE